MSNTPDSVNPQPYNVSPPNMTERKISSAESVVISPTTTAGQPQIHTPLGVQSTPADSRVSAHSMQANTAVLHDPGLQPLGLAGAGAGAGAGAQEAYTTPQHDPKINTDPENKAQGARSLRNRNLTLFTGIAIGALLGGLVGGGTAAVVSANKVPGPATLSQLGSSITVNNPDSVSAITAVAARATPSIVTLQVSTADASGSGSGVIYSEDGYILTNSHVVTLSGATSQPDIRVRLSDGTMLQGTLVGTDPFADIAVLKVDAENLPAIEIADSNQLNVGEIAVAIGAPLNLSNTVTSGIVSALNRGISVANSMVPEDADSESTEEIPEGGGQSPFPWDFRFELPQQQEQTVTARSTSRVAIPVLQTDASINPGNSGGALLNADGDLIGVNVALAANGASSGTAGSDGLGFAIPSNLAQRVAESLIAGEQPSHGKLGVSVVEPAQDTDEDRLREGALIAEISPDSAASASGLQIGDVITAIDGVAVDSSTTASALIRYNEGGSEVEITYSRAGVTETVPVKLGTLEW